MTPSHPFIGDLSEKTLEELQETLATLNKRLSYMYKINKPEMVNQLLMARTSYQAEYSKRQQALWDKNSSNSQGKIDIN